MIANVLHAINDLRVENVDLPTLKVGEVLVNVRACGICGSDVGRVFKTGTYHFPTVIGHEFSGVVKESPSNPELVGKRVGIFPLKPCFNCQSCRDEKFEMCSNYDYLGSRCDGGFEEYVAVPAWNLIELPETLSFEEAAMLEPVSVAIHALKQVGSIVGKSVMIIGPGTIGNIISTVAKAIGVRTTIMTGRTKQKLDFALRYGSDHVINSKTQDVVSEVKNLTDGLGADVVIEGTGAADSLAIAIKSVKNNGEIVLMGNPSGDIHLEKNVYWQILRRQLTLRGTWNSSFGEKFNDWKTALDYMESGKLDVKPLITHKLNMDELLKGLNVMRSGTEFSQKVMLINNA